MANAAWHRALHPKRVLLATFWLLSTTAAAGLVLGSESAEGFGSLPAWQKLAASHTMLPVFWFGFYLFRHPLRNFLGSIPLNSTLKFVLLGPLLAGVLAQWPVCVNMCGHYNAGGVEGADLSPNLGINILLYMISYGGTQLGWYVLKRFYQFDYNHVFWVTGIIGGIQEQGYMAPLLLVSGDVLGALIALVLAIPAYGVPIASIFVIFPPRELPRGQRSPGLPGYVLFVVVPQVTSLVLSVPVGLFQ